MEWSLIEGRRVRQRGQGAGPASHWLLIYIGLLKGSSETLEKVSYPCELEEEGTGRERGKEELGASQELGPAHKQGSDVVNEYIIRLRFHKTVTFNKFYT